jgi:hypothetical protein
MTLIAARALRVSPSSEITSEMTSEMKRVTPETRPISAPARAPVTSAAESPESHENSQAMAVGSGRSSLRRFIAGTHCPGAAKKRQAAMALAAEPAAAKPEPERIFHS